MDWGGEGEVCDFVKPGGGGGGEGGSQKKGDKRAIFELRTGGILIPLSSPTRKKGEWTKATPTSLFFKKIKCEKNPPPSG